MPRSAATSMISCFLGPKVQFVAQELEARQPAHALEWCKVGRVPNSGALPPKTTKDQTIQSARKPAFVEPMQCKPVTTLPTGEKWTFEIKFDGLPLRCGEASEERSRSSRVTKRC